MQKAAITASLVVLSLWAIPSAHAQYVNGPTRPEQGEVDLSGGWLQKFHEDNQERREAELGDYTAVPLNAAGRMRADTWDAGKWSVLEHQCEPHPADYAPHGPANFQISKIIDPNSMKTVAIQVIQGWMTSIRTIWLDGRPHPSPNAEYTWQGFSTGRWEGDTLIVTTTHLKEGWLRRNGLARSDKAKLTEYWMRHDNILTLVSIVDDPVYLTEPFVRSWNWVLDPGVHMYRYTCEAKLEADRPPNFVAYRPIGKNPFLNEYANKLHVPPVVTRGGSEQMYPEYKDTLRALLSGQDKPKDKAK
jgi:hypothetical protein